MTDANQLQRAYELIEADKLDEARIILEPIVADDNNNADAWWLYAHAVNEPNAARGAIQNVLRIDPEYPEAASLLNMLNQESASPAQPVTLTQPTLKAIKSIGSTGGTSAPVATDDDTPDFSDDDDDIDFDDTLPKDGDEKKSPFRLPAPVLAIILVVAIIIIGLLIVAILNPTGTPPSDTTGTIVAGNTESPTLGEVAGEPTSTPEEAVVEPTEAPEETEVSADGQSAPTPEEGGGNEGTEPTEEVVATEETGSSEVIGPEEAQAELVTALGDFTLAENPVETTETALGNTVIVNMCSTPEELRSTAIGAMEVIAENSNTFTDVDAFAVSISACDTGTTLRILGVSWQDAQDYISGTLSSSEFQAKWQPLG